MSHSTILQREHTILCNLSRLPRKILSLHNHDNITDLVLHELCSKECFNLSKAAYLVDNPDFNCLKGVSGFCQEECTLQNGCNIWDNPDDFAQRVHEFPFNKKVRNIERCSLKKGIQAELELAREIAQELDMKNPQFCLWTMKYDNHGLLIFEKSDSCDACPEDFLTNGCSLLGFCPVY